MIMDASLVPQCRMYRPSRQGAIIFAFFYLVQILCVSIINIAPISLASKVRWLIDLHVRDDWMMVTLICPSWHMLD